MFTVKVLDNGVGVALDSSLGVRSVTVCVAISAGSRYDDLSEPGSAHLVEHLVMAAPCADLGNASISKWVDSVGGQSNASTSHEAVTFWARVPPADAVDCARHLGNAIVAPAVTDALCASESQVVVQELLAAAGDPVDVAHEALYGRLFEGGPLSRPVGGRVEFPVFTADGVLASHRRNLRTAPVAISLVGPADLVFQAFEALRGSIGDIDREPCPFTPCGPPASGGAPTAEVEPDAEYAYLVAGGLGAGRDDPLWGAAEVLAAAVGGTPGSFLYDRLRGELGVSYQIQSGHTAYRDTGVWSITAGSEPRQADRVESTIRDCLTAVSSGGLGDDGFAAARTQAAGSVLLDNEDPVARAHLNSTWGLDSGDEPPVDRLRRLINSVDHQAVRAIASQVLRSYTHVVAS
ncbi:M16 family metallopeptidase [Saccharothrix luteola]|uniref:M16 family metallopeptidase n=1 Tax=Saccharothrix luteola TaxID=2893018 RepID=UPI001E3F77F9|nr:pitrilysin family protein [Saccharothrix luteola]MCC8251530.1 insulinase family protein [Saccharothrix luteola]